MFLARNKYTGTCGLLCSFFFTHHRVCVHAWETERERERSVFHSIWSCHDPLPLVLQPAGSWTLVCTWHISGLPSLGFKPWSLCGISFFQRAYYCHAMEPAPCAIETFFKVCFIHDGVYYREGERERETESPSIGSRHIVILFPQPSSLSGYRAYAHTPGVFSDHSWPCSFQHYSSDCYWLCHQAGSYCAIWKVFE